MRSCNLGLQIQLQIHRVSGGSRRLGQKRFSSAAVRCAQAAGYSCDSPVSFTDPWESSSANMCDHLRTTLTAWYVLFRPTAFSFTPAASLKKETFPGRISWWIRKQSRLFFCCGCCFFFDFGRTKRYSGYHQSKLLWVVVCWRCTCCTFSTFHGLRVPKATSKGWIIISVSVGKNVTYFHYKTTPFWV